MGHAEQEAMRRQQKWAADQDKQTRQQMERRLAQKAGKR